MNKIKIVCNENNRAERLYILNTFFNEFDNVVFDLQFKNSTTSYVFYYNDNKLSIEDAFFSKFKKELDYLNSKHLPEKVKAYNSSPFNNNPPVIFGDDTFEMINGSVNCGLDIFASAFFMLTRWEEFVINEKNREGRPDEFFLLSVKERFFNRPVVDEYIDLLQKLLSLIEVEARRKKRNFNVVISHDVDWVYLSSQKELLTNLSLRLQKKGQVKKSFKIFYDYYYNKVTKTNPFDCFDELLKLYKEYNLKSAFYFKAVQKGELGFTYDVRDKRVQKVIKKIENANQEIGFHPSENTVFNDEQFEIEKERLQNMTKQKLVGGRNHGLFYNETTYSQWEDNGFIYDSGMGYQYMNGFRNGATIMFPIFDILQRKQLKLFQRPFIAMDTVVFRKKTKPDQFYEEVTALLNIVKKFNGSVSINWHSNLINSKDLKHYKPTFINILKHISELYELV